MRMGNNALIVDSDATQLRQLGLLMKKAGFEPVLAASGRQASAMFANSLFYVAIINSAIQDMKAIEIARALRRRMEAENFGPFTRVIAIVFNAAEAKSFPPYLFDGFLVAPFSAADFHRIVGGDEIRKSENQGDNGVQSGGFDAKIAR